jgi:hypothetical protein
MERLHGQDHDLAIAQAAGVGGLLDQLDHFLQPAVVDPNFDLKFGKKGEGVFGLAILIEIVLLPAIAADFTHGQCFDRCPQQGFDHWLGQVRFDDGEDLLHLVFISLALVLRGEGRGEGLRRC